MDCGGYLPYTSLNSVNIQMAGIRESWTYCTSLKILFLLLKLLYCAPISIFIVHTHTIRMTYLIQALHISLLAPYLNTPATFSNA